MASTRMPRGVWVLGFVSLFMDISSELIHSLLPVFMVTGLGASALMVGVVEGIAEATALIVKVFSGTLSDWLGRRKGLTVVGYGLGALSKPVFALALSVHWVFVARFMDRIGKGIRGAPRDALIADMTSPEIRGAAYGLRQSLDTIGAFIGPLAAIGLMILWAGDFRAVFWFAVIPGVISVLLLVFFIREPGAARPARGAASPIQWRTLGDMGRAYWWIVAAGGAFTLARFSEAFLVLRAQQLGLPDAWTPIVLVVMNVVYSISAYPFGRLADRVSHVKLLAIGLVVLMAADVVLALAHGMTGLVAGVALWGLHMGMTQGLLATMVAGAAPERLRGTAFGFFNLASGIAMLAASVLAGALWDGLGPATTFYAGAVFCGITLAVLALARGRLAAAIPAGK
jgi:MFS family permease